MADNPPNRSYRSDDRHGARSSARGGGAIGDPLAELARLIGQSDPFNGAGHGGPARAAAPKPPAAASPSSSPTGAADWREMAAAMRPFERLRDEPGETVAPDELPARSGPGEDRQGADGFEDIYADDRQYAHAEPDDDPYYDEGAPTTPRDEDMYDDPRRPSRRSGLITAVMLIGCAMIGTAGAYAYRSYYVGSGSNRTLPVIAADTTPSKVVSSVDPQPTKSIQDRLRDQSQERVVSREEQPLELTNPPMPPAPRIVLPAPVAPSQPQAASPGQAGGRQTTASIPSSSMSAGATAAGAEPKRIRTVTIRPDGTDLGVSPAAGMSPPPGQTVPTRSGTAAKSSQVPRSGGPLSLDPLASPSGSPPQSPERIATAPASTALVTVQPASTSSTAGSGGYVVQLSSQRSEAEAQASFRSLQAKFPDQLGGRGPIIRRADLGDKGTYYRAMVGPFASSEEAGRFCGSYKSAGGQCIIQRN